MKTIEQRRKILINTDPQRRCYNGCHFSYELVWSEWESLESNTPDDRVEARLEFWRELNEYAVKCRGKEALKEFRAV